MTVGWQRGLGFSPGITNGKFPQDWNKLYQSFRTVISLVSMYSMHSPVSLGV